MRLARTACVLIGLALAGLVLVAPSPAAATPEQVRAAIMEELVEDGYRRITVGKTWLGRLRFVATRPGARREIVVNPATGEILRDFSRFSLPRDSAGGSGFGSSGGGDDDDDPDYDDDAYDDADDDDDERDNSGPGSENSGRDDDDERESDDSGSDSSNSGSGSSNSGSGSSDDDD